MDPRHSTVDPQHVTLDPRPSTLDISTKSPHSEMSTTKTYPERVAWEN